MKKKSIITVGIVIAVFVCSTLLIRLIKITGISSDYIYNGYSSEFIFDDEKYAYTKNLAPKIINKNESVDFDIEMFSKSSKKPMYSDGTNVYFLTDDNGIYYYDQKFNMHCLISNKKILDTSFLGDWFSNDGFIEMQDDYLNSATQFVVVGTYIYLYCPGGVFRYNLITHFKSTIYDGKTGETSFSYSDYKIYFQDELYNLYCYDTEKNEFIELDIKPYSFCVNNKGILFSDLENDMYLTYYDFEKNRKYIIRNNETIAYDLDEDMIYYSVEGEYYKSELTGKGKVMLCKDKNSSILKKGVNCLYIVYDYNGDVKVDSIDLKTN